MDDRSCNVSPEGDKITIGLSRKGDHPQQITLSFEEASALAMTLPRLLTVAMRQRFSDEAVRHVYPIEAYTVECASDHRHVLLTLSCGGGFDIVFGIDVNIVPTLARDLAAGQALLKTSSSLRPN